MYSVVLYDYYVVLLFVGGITGVIAVNELHTHQKHVTVTDVVKWNSSMPVGHTFMITIGCD